MFALTTEPRSSDTRNAARIYAALAILRAPGSLAAERLFGWTGMSGWATESEAAKQRLFLHEGHSLLFAGLMLWGAFQLLLGWRWLARGGVGIPTRVVYMLLIFVGGVVALLLTRLLLPRHVRASPRLERQGGLEPLPARA